MFINYRYDRKDDQTLLVRLDTPYFARGEANQRDLEFLIIASINAGVEAIWSPCRRNDKSTWVKATWFEKAGGSRTAESLDFKTEIAPFIEKELKAYKAPPWSRRFGRIPGATTHAISLPFPSTANTTTVISGGDFTTHPDFLIESSHHDQFTFPGYCGALSIDLEVTRHSMASAMVILQQLAAHFSAAHPTLAGWFDTEDHVPYIHPTLDTLIVPPPNPHLAYHATQQLFAGGTAPQLV
ncbi:hypothetical protein L198_00109 [Cryptococcus wingfieldii CBS 7118]|uniref:Uncharacterized protein n=1 Tax=Cryptococcus wingfieldii CBS 7118 TaxID=1295528 RepID=A0A1E3K5A6_9TREE|nr:hypothetical protein L198_00109 [Cryptococcus wingfieldii CBS 7118]ODO08384.1 hypothetical protein L198_00109 [Cryptococcus wingfieldii CBS 7118]